MYVTYLRAPHRTTGREHSWGCGARRSRGAQREWDEVIQVVVESLLEGSQPLPESPAPLEGEYPMQPSRESPMLPVQQPQRESPASPECPALMPEKENPASQFLTESSAPQLLSERECPAPPGREGPAPPKRNCPTLPVRDCISTPVKEYLLPPGRHCPALPERERVSILCCQSPREGALRCQSPRERESPAPPEPQRERALRRQSPRERESPAPPEPQRESPASTP
ncbi:UNVERIFIED_CONTAM: hypothetical protein FKN15_036618 [Acipenser sinensis]